MRRSLRVPPTVSLSAPPPCVSPSLCPPTSCVFLAIPPSVGDGYCDQGNNNAKCGTFQRLRSVTQPLGKRFGVRKTVQCATKYQAMVWQSMKRGSPLSRALRRRPRLGSDSAVGVGVLPLCFTLNSSLQQCGWWSVEKKNRRSLHPPVFATQRPLVPQASNLVLLSLSLSFSLSLQMLHKGLCVRSHHVVAGYGLLFLSLSSGRTLKASESMTRSPFNRARESPFLRKSLIIAPPCPLVLCFSRLRRR